MKQIALAFSMVLAVAGTAAAYDDSWYEADFWSGEYPPGFSVAEETTVPMRPEPDPTLPATLECVLPKGATYHPWNHDRVASEELGFRSFSKKHTYTIKKAYTAALSEYRGDDASIKFAKGDTWTYLAYLAEGMFLIERGGKMYVAGQDLFEVSDTTNAPTPVSDEWLNLPCLNGVRGWLLLSEVTGKPGIAAANIIGYPQAEDLLQ